MRPNQLLRPAVTAFRASSLPATAQFPARGPRFSPAAPTKPANMSTVSISDIRYIQPPQLAEKLLAQQGQPPEKTEVAVVDVRDVDHIGGHIKNSLNIHSDQLDAYMPTLLRKFEGKKTVVFHCMLSQQRGPRAALKYLRALEEKRSSSQGKEAEEEGKQQQQQVVVLEGGFSGWQQHYGPDERLTEGWVEDFVW